MLSVRVKMQEKICFIYFIKWGGDFKNAVWDISRYTGCLKTPPTENWNTLKKKYKPMAYRTMTFSDAQQLFKCMIFFLL